MARTTNVREERIEMTAVDKSLSTGVRGAQREIKALGSSIDTVRNVLGMIAGGGVAGLAGRAIVNATKESEQASNRLTAVLRATGHQAGITQREIDELAESMQESLGFDDEKTRNAASALLKFGNIHGDVFRGAMKLSGDLAAFMGTDVPDAAQMLGKSLQSPTEGLMMMERNFGKLTKEEENHINTLVRQGKAVEAQNAVLELWRQKIGGTAALMNTGLTKATRDVANAWDDMLQAMGKSDAFGGRAESALGGLKTLLGDIRRELEGEQTPLSALMIEFANAVAAVGSVGLAGRLGGEEMPWNVFGSVTPQKLGERTPASETERLRRWEEEMRAFQGRLLAGKLKLGGDATKQKSQKSTALTAERIAELQFEGEEQLAKDTAEAWKFWTDQQLKDQKTAADAQTLMWKQVFETIDREQEEAIEEGRILLEGLNAEAKRGEEFARELGLTFTSAFEDAIVGGKGLREVLRGLEQDILRIVTRKLVTKPLGTAIAGMVKGSSLFGDIGDWFKKLFGAQHGADFMVGGAGGIDSQLVAFRASPDERVIVQTPQQQRGRGGDTYNIYAPGADPAALAHLESVIRTLNARASFRSASAHEAADMAARVSSGMRWR